MAQNDQIHFSVNKNAKTTPKISKTQTFFSTIEGNSGTNISLQRFPNLPTTLESPVELINLHTSPYTIKYKSLGPEPGIGSR